MQAIPNPADNIPASLELISTASQTASSTLASDPPISSTFASSSVTNLLQSQSSCEEEKDMDQGWFICGMSDTLPYSAASADCKYSPTPITRTVQKQIDLCFSFYFFCLFSTHFFLPNSRTCVCPRAKITAKLCSIAPKWRIPSSLPSLRASTSTTGNSSNCNPELLKCSMDFSFASSASRVSHQAYQTIDWIWQCPNTCLYSVVFFSFLLKYSSFNANEFVCCFFFFF
jgi:hypothetical protein